jgi:glutamyl-tRNA synthetase
MQTVVTRFPPSPTGHLHIGGARTALFNWLLARNQGGRFVLRIEDTDTVRSSQEMTESIVEAMGWLGLDWDEGPFFQSQRTDLYHEHIDRLLDTGQAYYCACTPDEVEAMRERARQQGSKPKYDGTCRDRGLEPGPGRVVRFKAPLDGETAFDDAVRGHNVVDNRELDDFVLRRADGTVTYNLAVVVDDASMGINHILRGDDHLSNTPKQVLLYRALGFELPRFGHVPMILGPDKKRLSKRHGAMSVLEYKRQGYLPKALVNYLARLGWSYGDQELFEVDELVDKFSMDSLGRAACVFDPDKLEWVNSQHIKRSQPDELVEPLAGFLAGQGLTGIAPDYLQTIIPLLQPRAATLSQMADLASFFVQADEDIVYDPEHLDKLATPEVREHLSRLSDRLAQAPSFAQADLEEVVRGYVQETGIKFKLLAQPIRLAITGRTASPGLFETMEALGRDSTLRRFQRFLDAGEPGQPGKADRA